ncbi:MAG: isoaspartyl peptidase/L-asparaginase family protein [Bacteroidia bacterium]
MNTRRNFLRLSALGGLLGTALLNACAQDPKSTKSTKTVNKPIVLSTWNHGQAANAAAWEVLNKGGRALDAVEAGVRVTESDPNVRTVGIGGYPDQEGHVTLDACIMDEKGDCGSVAFLQHIENPISVARKVMEETPHVMLVGAGALKFAEEQGFERKDLLTEQSRKDWQAWLAKENKPEKPIINVENHDTIGLLAMDADGNISGACTTSGASYKLHGRVGDSPIIGAGLFVDNAIGGAVATGWGEAVIRVVGCHLTVEFMRQGHSPEEACRLAVERVCEKNPDYKDIQVGFLALNKQGEYGSYCIQDGFDYAILDQQTDNQLIKAQYKVKA